MDYTTCYLEALPLCKASSKAIAQELMLLFSCLGISMQILTDQGTRFTSRLMADLCQLLQVCHLKTLVYHHQTDDLVERFNPNPQANAKDENDQWWPGLGYAAPLCPLCSKEVTTDVHLFYHF